MKHPSKTEDNNEINFRCRWNITCVFSGTKYFVVFYDAEGNQQSAVVKLGCHDGTVIGV